MEQNQDRQLQTSLRVLQPTDLSNDGSQLQKQRENELGDNASH